MYKCITCILVTALLAQPFSYPAFADTTSEKIKKAEELKKQTEARKEEVEQKKDALEDEKDQLQIYLTQLNDDLEEISESLADLEEQVTQKEAQINEAAAELESAKQEELVQYALMKKRIKYIYERGDTSLLETFLSAASYSEFLNKAEYVSKVEEYDQRMFENLVAMRKDIETREAVLEAERKELITLQEQAETEHSKVNDMVHSTSGSLAATNGAISAAALEEAAYEAELKAQEAKKSKLSKKSKQLAEEQAMSARAAKMAWRDVSELTFEEGDRELLACLIYCEAGAEPHEGQVAVGAVVINRMRSAAYPNTMVGVIYQNRQFSPVASGRLATRLALGANSSCYAAADEAMKGQTPVGNCLYFRTVIPEINGQIIGGHVFY